MVAKALHLDLETRSDVDLPACGLYVYADSPHTDILVACYAFDDGPVNVWYPGQPVPIEIISHIELGGEVHAHNASFEQHLINSVGVRKYGWPRIYTDQLVCTLAMSYAMGLPGHLGATAAALGIPEQKSEEGKRLMMQVSQPRDIKPNGEIVWWDMTENDRLQKLTDYCRQDVVVERAIAKRMKLLSAYEQKVWQLDQKINDRGITVDVPAAYAAMRLVEDEKKRLNTEIQTISHGMIASAQAMQQIKDYMKFRCVQLPESLAKKELADLIGKIDLPNDVRKILKIRQEAGKASTAKLNSMIKGACEDGRLRGMFQYSGANTRRWAGRRVQLQNLKRPSIKQKQIDWVLDNLTRGLKAESIDMMIGSPMDVIGDCIRGFLIAGEGRELIVADFNAIEARVLAWLAGEQRVLDIFENGEDVYVHAASASYGIPIERVTSEQRQVGKVAVLALGYGGGVGAFRTIAKGHDVSMADAFSALWERCSPDQRDFLEKSFDKNKSRYDDIAREEYLASDVTKVFWRETHPAIVKYWADLEAAATSAVENPDKKFTAGPKDRKITYCTRGSFLWCQMPSGGVICYPYPKVQTVETPWGKKKQGLTYMSEDGQSKHWQRFKTYGGSLAENITQAVARDLLADSMLRLEDAGYPVIAHVHDEVLCELPMGQGSVSEMERIMSVNPPWAKGLPLAAKGWRGKRFRK